MAQDTYGTLYKGLLLRCPDLPLPLAQDFIKTAYRRILGRHEWSGTRGRSGFQIPAAYTTGTAAVTQNSTAVTGTSTVWTSAMVGRQFKVSNGPYYTISAVGGSTSLTLDRVYDQTTDSAATYSISQAYVTPPADFLSFASVIDPENRWRLRKGLTQEYLDSKDPQRARTGPARVLAGMDQSSNIPRFELWPRITSAAYLPFSYYKEVTDPSADADKIIFPVRGETVMMGAQYELSKWPGTTEKPNPYFNLGLAGKLQQDYEADLAKDLLRDQALYLTDFYRAEDLLPYAPMDYDTMRNFDINTLA